MCYEGSEADEFKFLWHLHSFLLPFLGGGEMCNFKYFQEGWEASLGANWLLPGASSAGEDGQVGGASLPHLVQAMEH